MLVFTDGSKTGSRTGSGVAIYEDGNLTGEHSYGLPSHTTVFQPELVAIMKSLELCSSRYEFNVYSDSRSSLQALTIANSLHPLSVHLHELRSGMTIRWFWVKAHVGTADNETAGRLAKAGTELNNIDVHVKMPPDSSRPELGQRSSVSGRNIGMRKKQDETSIRSFRGSQNLVPRLHRFSTGQ